MTDFLRLLFVTVVPKPFVRKIAFDKTAWDLRCSINIIHEIGKHFF